LEPLKWVYGVEQAELLNMLLVPHYHRSAFNTVCVHQLLVLVHDGCLWLGQPIPITDMFIDKITNFPHKGANLAKEFGGKMGEKELDDKMKKEYGIVKKS